MTKLKVGDRVRLIRDGLSTDGATGMLAYVRDTVETMRDYPIKIEIDEGGAYKSLVAREKDYRWTWIAEDRLELVTPSIPSPIVTKTITRVEPGVYGRLRVGNSYDGNSVWVEFIGDGTLILNASEIRSAIETLTSILTHLEKAE